MFASKASGVKKRRAPLPEEVYPDLAKETSNLVNETCDDSGSTSTERLPMALPQKEPVIRRQKLTALEEISTSSRHSWVPDSGVAKLLRKRRSIDDIDFLSDNEVLDVQRQSENVKALENIEYHDGHHKRHSSGDVSKILHQSSSKSSLRSLDLSEESFSLNNLTSSYGTDTVDGQMVDQEDILTLTAHVRHFSDALSKLRIVIPGNGSDTDSDENTDGGNAVEEMHVKAHESLGKVLSNLKEVINRYPSLKSSEILAAAGNLISKVRSLNHVDNKCPDDFYHAIDQLALVFGSSISDLLMGDQELSPNKAGDDGDDGDDFPDDEDYGSEGDMLSESMSIPSRQDPSCSEILRDKDADLDRVLLKMESGVDFCLQWTKCWSKYVKDIANYIEKRAQLEAEYTKQLTKLAQGTRASISEENYLPFQSTFITALDQDMEYAQKCQQTLAAISGSKFMEPLMQRRTVHDRARKDMKDEWTKTCRQLQETASSVKTSQHNYHKRKQDLEKLNTISNKNKKEEELRTKVEEADQFYCNAIKVANDMQDEAEKTKVRIVAQTKQLVNECDRTFRSVTRKYFDLMHELAVPTPIHFKILADSCQGYEPGKEFEDFIRFQQSTARCAVRPLFEFQPFGNAKPNNGIESPLKASLSPAKAWPTGHMSDYEGGASPSGSPSSSPKNSKKNPRNNPPPSTDDESEGEMKKPKSNKHFRTGRRPKKFPKGPLTKEASTHTFHKIRAPARCSECDSYVFSGVECAQCGLSCHTKKCLENLQTSCSHSRRLPGPMKRMRTFGVRFSEDGGVPVLVTKCVKEINRRGLRVKGIYRVSGVKSKMESLCQEFETNAESVDLSTQPPHLIASVLKLYIRQLPEPLMTTKLYSDLIQLAKDSANLNWLTVAEYEDDQKKEFKKFLEKLQSTIKKLPRSNYLTTATLIKHLHKVSINEQYNQMSPQNLAIVFGPTILKLESENSTTSLSSLVDMSHQTRIVALLIVNPQVFDDVPDEPEANQENVSNEENDSSLPNTPVEKFITPKFEGESGMPDLYGERSTRVRGEGLSPMDQLVSQSSNPTDIKRSNSDSLRINERVDIKGEATRVFDEDPNHLPGSLEEPNKYLELTPNEEKLPVLDQLTDIRRSRDAERNQTNEKMYYNSKLEESKIGRNNDSSKSSDDGSLIEEIQDEFNKKLQSKVSVDLAKEGGEEFPSPGDSSDDSCIPRRRSKAFSVGKRNNDPDMLAKRGSALMNAYMGDNNIMPEDPESTPSLQSVQVVDSSETNDLKQENNVGANVESLPITSTESNLSANETTDSDVTPVNTESEDHGHRTRAGTASAAAALRSVDESSISALYRDSPRRKRSATCESDRRKMFENRQERPEKQHTSDRLLIYGVRTRHTRVSVKDKVKQLENREQNDSRSGPLGARNSKPSAVVTSANNIGSKTIDTQSTSGHDNENTNNTFDIVDGKENANGNTECVSESPQVKSHEPLTRLYAAGENSGIFQPPRSPVSKHKTVEDKFCALKMDISLESYPTPSSSDDDSENTRVAMETHLLPTWQGRGLTPRDSRQEPEFV